MDRRRTDEELASKTGKQAGSRAARSQEAWLLSVTVGCLIWPDPWSGTWAQELGS